MRCIDTHCHIQFSPYDEDRTAVIDECLSNDVGLMVVGCDAASSRAACVLADQYPTQSLWAAVGHHPTDNPEDFDEYFFRTLAVSTHKVRAIGETGLDYFHLDVKKDVDEQVRRQKEVFLAQCDIAHDLALPLIIHCREAHDDMIGILENRFGSFADNPSTREHGVIHCFTGTVREAQSYLDLGFMISLTGVITFTHDYDEVIRTVPLEKMMIETDAPFLSPVPHRGKRNHPRYVEYIAKKIAEVRGVTTEEVLERTTRNAVQLFGLE